MGAIKKIVLAVIVSAALTMMLLDHKSTQPLLAQTPSGGYGPGGGGGGAVTLNAVLDPTADKTFALGVNSLFFTTTNADGDHLSAGWQTANSHFVIASSTDVYPNMNRAPLFAQNVVGTIGDHSAGAAFGTGSELPAITADIQTVINGAGAKLATAASVEADPPAVVGAGASITEAAALWVPDFGYGNPPSGTHVYGLLVGDLSGWAGTDSIGVRVQDQSGSNLAIKTGLGKVELGDVLVLDSVAVGALPAAAAGNKGWMRTVSDSTAVAAEGQTCVGGNTNTALAFSNGVQWKCF